MSYSKTLRDVAAAEAGDAKAGKRLLIDADTVAQGGHSSGPIGDAEVGANMLRLRERAGLTQKELGDQMRTLGHKWSQATVWSVEKGERPLRLTEAASLSLIFNEDVGALMLRADEGQARAIVEAAHMAEERLRAFEADFIRKATITANTLDDILERGGRIGPEYASEAMRLRSAVRRIEDRLNPPSQTPPG